MFGNDSQKSLFTYRPRKSSWRRLQDLRRANKPKGILSWCSQPLRMWCPMKLNLCIFVSWRGGSCYNLGGHCGSQTTMVWNRAMSGSKARLTRSKTLGSDKSVSSRLVVADQEAYIRNRTWRKDGCHFLQRQAPFERDYLLPAASVNFSGVHFREHRYDTAFGVQSRILSSLCHCGNRRFNFAFPRFWSPHSGRNFLPTAASALGIWTQEKNLLEGWSARGSEQYNRLAKSKIAQIQREVVNRIWDKDAQDPLSETDSLRELTEFFRAQLIDETEITRSIRLLPSRRYVEMQRPAQIAPVGIQLEETLEVDEDLVERGPKEIVNEKRQAWNKEKTRKLGDDPKKYRADL